MSWELDHVRSNSIGMYVCKLDFLLEKFKFQVGQSSRLHALVTFPPAGTYMFEIENTPFPQTNELNIFSVNNKDSRTRSVDVRLIDVTLVCYSLNIEHIFTLMKCFLL